MSAQVVGVDIGTDSIRAVELAGAGKSRPTVVRYHEIALPEGAVKSGEVIEVNTVAAALKQLWTTGKFSSKGVVLGVGSPKVLVRDLALPKLSYKETRESLPAHVQDLLPVPVAEALLDFYPISESASDTGPMIHGLLVAAVKSSVLANVKAVQQAGLTPVGVDLIPFALTRLHNSAGNLAYIDVGAKTTNVIVTSDGVPQFVRIIATGGHDLTMALSDRLQIPLQDAENLKPILGLGGGSVSPEHAPAVNVIREVTGELLNSLRNTLAYFSNMRQNEPYAGVILSGGGASLAGFADALGEISRIPVVMVDPFANVILPKHLHNVPIRQRQSMNVALGLAMGSAA